MHRRIVGLAGAALALALTGCTAPSGSTITATGKTLTVYLSVPSGVALDQGARDVVDAARLAFAQQGGGGTGSLQLRLKTLDATKPSDNARAAIEDTSAIAYIGEISPGSSTQSVGITNFGDLLQVTPTDTAVELTRSTGAVPGAPSHYFESLKSYGRTFARVVPNTAQEALAQVREMRSLSVRRLYVGDDGSQYGKAIALAVRQAAASSIAVVATPAGADGVFYGARSAGQAGAFFNQVARSSPKAKLFGPSALFEPGFASSLGAGVRNLYISRPGFLPSRLPAAARRSFVGPFKASYHRAPSVQAIFGYEAMAAVLAVLREEGARASDRGKVVHEFFAIRNRNSVLGSYSINADGDTSIAPFVFSRLQGGKLVPFKFVPAR